MAGKKGAAAAKRGDDANGDGQDAAKVGFTGHHQQLIARGANKLFVSRPRGKPYTIEEWIGPDRRYKLFKVTDEGHITAFEESASHADPAMVG